MQIKSELIRNTSVTLGGNIIGQAVAFLAWPVLTRIYSEAEFGIFATYTSICSLLVILGTARYEESLVIARNRRETVALLGFSLKWLFTFSIFAALILTLFHTQIFNILNMNAMSPFRHYIPVTIFLTGLLTLLNNLSVRNKKFKTIATANIAQSSANAACKLTFGMASLTRFGLIWSNIIALFTAGCTYNTLRKHLFRAIRCPLKESTAAALRYRDFPTYNLSRSLLNALSANLPLYMIGTFGAEETGLYSLALFTLTAPVTLICSSLFSAFFEQISTRARHHQPILPLIKSYWKNLTIYILPCFAIMILIARPFFATVFGSSWADSGIYFQYMAPWWFMVMTTSPLHSIFIIFRKQRMTLIAETIYLFIRAFALYIGVYFADLKLGITAFSISGIIFAIFYIQWIYRTVTTYENKHKHDKHRITEQ
jgi:O-antigen/teichoic acid export membrane protein